MFLAHDDTMHVLAQNLEKAIDTASVQKKLETVRTELAQTQQNILQAAQSGEDIEALAEKLDILKRRETHLEGEAVQQKQKAARIREMKATTKSSCGNSSRKSPSTMTAASCGSSRVST